MMTIRDPLMPETPEELRNAELYRLRAEVAALRQQQADDQETISASAVELRKLRAEVARLQGLLEAKDELLSTPSYAAANWRRAHKEVAAERDRLRARLHAVTEVYAGMDGFIPQTAPESYLQRIVKQMYDAAAGEEK